jgi:plastocyanin
MLLKSMTHQEATWMNRRQLMRAMGRLGLGAAGAVALGRVAWAAPRGGHGRHTHFQEGGTSPAVATPQVGPRPDGTTLWRVQVGAMDMDNKLDFHAFFPGEITVNAGDSIWFDFGEAAFNTVTFLSGADPIPLAIPDPEAATPAADLPPLIINSAGILPSGGETYAGTGVVNSGFAGFRDGQPFVLTFTTPGAYDYLSLTRSDVMKGKVFVQRAGAAIPTDQAGYDRLAVEQTEALRRAGLAEIEKYREPKATARADGTTLWELTAGTQAGQARVMAFLPEPIVVAVGDTIRWVNRSPSEPHTVSFIGADGAPPEDIVPGAFADGSPKFALNPLTLWPQGDNVWRGTGWVHSGWLGLPELGLPTKWELTFAVEGEFTAYCIFHGDAQGNGMAANVKVNPRG